ncbi:MAG: cytochrome c peroxidase, partial [Mesorhizobium sp.]|nr:cytochrome c peroxidase [Mesorhizobium sp.]
MRSLSRLFLVAIGILLPLVAGCGREEFSASEKQTIASLSLDALPPLPDDPSNRFAANRQAAALGATLFFEQRLSRDGDVACATCHLIDRQFQDDRPLGKGVGTTDRRTMPLSGVAYSPWQFWDGRKDSLWSQALGPMEDSREHAGTRTAYAHVVAEHFKDRYERIFGPLPDLVGLPRSAGPLGTDAEKAAWNALPPERRTEIDTVFANLGKAIAAFERSILPRETRFDRFARAVAAGRAPGPETSFDAQEVLGLKLFIGRANCVTCHTGARFTDDHFHNTGVPQATGLPEDLGRAAALEKVLADPFNCLGPYSDAAPEQCGELRFVTKDNPEMVRAFKTPSLRGASSRPPYMHSGQIATLDDVLDHYARAPLAPSGTSELKPLTLSERERKALAA